MNPLMHGMGIGGGVNPQAIQQVKRMMNMFRAASNPQQMLMQAAQQNPAISTVMQMCSGKNPKDVFYEQCQKMGVNPDDIINQLR